MNANLCRALRTFVSFTAGVLLCSFELFAHYPSINRHLQLAGSGYLSVPNNASLNATLAAGAQMTIDAWIYPTSFMNTPTIVGNARGTGYWFGLSTAGKLRFYPSGTQYRESNATIPLNAWTHVAVTYHAGTMEARFYINNALDATHAGFQSVIAGSTGDLRIGADRAGANPDFYFNGRIDEVRIWRVVLPFNSAAGLLYRVPHQFVGGRFGKNLVSAWRLNGNGADSASANNGTAVGTVSWQSSPNPPHYSRIAAVMMNNSGQNHDYFTVPHHSSIAFTGSFTLECWVSLSTASGGATTFQTFLSKGVPSGNATYWLGVNKQNGRLRFMPNGAWSAALESSEPLPTNAWVHVAGRFFWSGNSGTATVFINGVVKGTANYTTKSTPNTYPLCIGTADYQAGPPASYPLFGKIDEARLWNTARSDAEIGNNHRFELDGAITNLVASYHFEGDVLDRSSMNNHGSNANPNALDLYFLDASDLPLAPTLAVTSPNGGESWQIGSAKQITWSSTGLHSVNVELSRDGGASFAETIASNVPASQSSLGWTVTAPPTTAARIRISSSTPTGLSDESNASFTIAEPPPVMNATPASLDFIAAFSDPSPPPKKVYLMNSGGGTMAWSATANQPWINLTPTSGAANADSVEVKMTATNLPVGIHTATVTLAGNAVNAPCSVNVTYRIVPGPHINAVPPTVFFATTLNVDPPSQTIFIRNTSNGTLHWTASTAAPWLSIAPSSGKQNDSIVITAFVSGKAAGRYTSSVSIIGNADNAPFDIPVELVISDVGLYAVSGEVRRGSLGIPGITINVAGDTTLAIKTKSDGSFSFPGLKAGQYQLIPTSDVYSFAPASHSITIASTPLSGILFVATPKTGSYMFRYKQGWNLISLPVRPATPPIAALFPDAELPARAFRYSPDSGYIIETTLDAGVGYWIKFTKTDSVAIAGALCADLSIHLTVSGGGWNMIGTVLGTLPFSSVTQNPPGAINSIFEYESGLGYRIPPSGLLQAGRGYFVKTAADADIFFFTGSVRAPANTSSALMPYPNERPPSRMRDD